MIPPDTKVLILHNKLMDYRIPIWNLIAKACDLTVAYCEGKGHDGCEFKTIRLREPRNIGPIAWHYDNLRKLCNDYDIVITVGNTRWIKYMILPFGRHKYKTATWSLGVSASYSKGYDQNRTWDFVRDFFYKRCDACIFYTDYVVRKNLKRGYKRERMFVAHNTVKVLPLKPDVTKDSILFIGTLYKAKGIQTLLDSYKAAYVKCPDLPTLNIVGGGDEYEQIAAWISEAGLNGRIIMHGPIYDKAAKRDLFQRAYACISPKQAGLSVLESLGYGVPFITRKNAITGGEIFNINDGETGLLLDEDSQFETAILDIAENPDKYIGMGQRAQEYYQANRTPEIMAQGVIDAIDFLANS